MRSRASFAFLLGLAGVMLSSPASAQQTPAAAIQDLIDGSHILFSQGVLDGFGHVSARNPANPQRFFMTRSRAPSEVTPDDIIEFDLEGKPVGGPANGQLVFRELHIHAAVYRARSDVKGVVHSHSPNVLPFGVVEAALRPVAATTAFLCGGVPNFDIAEKFGATNLLVTSREKGEALATSLGARPIVLMRGHGNTVVGATVRRAAYQAVFTELAARLQMQAMQVSGGKPIRFLTDAECALRLDELKREDANPKGSEGVDRNWETWRRQAAERRGK